ncbi:MAG TPA: ATP-binding cassette domain-containing protein [Patescibacteria group bacterium]|nr:ATP-binding cassette domain-containing protein [Patescibacteria group bacterium]
MYWDMTMEQLLANYPHTADFFAALPPVRDAAACSVQRYFDNLSEEQLQDQGVSRQQLQERFGFFLELMEQLQAEKEPVESITILGGHNKRGRIENIRLTICAGEIVTIVGATGSGKSRLLADIEWMAQQDTPTGRQILINGRIPDTKYRFSPEHKLVAQLSQNMNFVVDLSVREFIGMHAESRMVENVSALTGDIIARANQLAGESFAPDDPVTALSGGQSRALMIADTAYLSSSPIVLIDEIENAGIDRQAALRLLVNKQKIVLMATHDPILALMGDKRLVIKNGGIEQVLEPSPAERNCLRQLVDMDEKMSALRNSLRDGERIEALPWL